LRATRKEPDVSTGSIGRERARDDVVMKAGAADTAADLLQKAQRFADQGEDIAARECCERLIRISGPSAQAFYLLGLLDDAKGSTADAIEHYRRALYLDPHHYEALIHLAILIEGAGDVAAARRFYARAKRAAPARADA
jgi:chemotaxis protein methyltransferase WspC